jgi:hypothetical protein
MIGLPGYTAIKPTIKPLTDKNDVIGTWSGEGKEPLLLKLIKVQFFTTGTLNLIHSTCKAI